MGPDALVIEPDGRPPSQGEAGATNKRKESGMVMNRSRQKGGLVGASAGTWERGHPKGEVFVEVRNCEFGDNEERENHSIQGDGWSKHCAGSRLSG